MCRLLDRIRDRLSKRQLNDNHINMKTSSHRVFLPEQHRFYNNQILSSYVIRKQERSYNVAHESIKMHV